MHFLSDVFYLLDYRCPFLPAPVGTIQHSHMGKSYVNVILLPFVATRNFIIYKVKQCVNRSVTVCRMPRLDDNFTSGQ